MAAFSRSRFALVFLAACALLGAPAVSLAKPGDTPPASPFAPPPTAQDRIPQDEPVEELAKPEDTSERQELLRDLYEQLEASGDADNAQLLAAAIEKLWLQSGSDTVDLLMERSAKAIEEKKLDLALKLLGFVTKLAPDFPEGWNRRAMVHYLKRDFGLSMRDLRQVLARDPRHFKAIHGLALLLQEVGNKKAALKALRKAMQVHPFLNSAKESERELSREVEGQGI